MGIEIAPTFHGRLGGPLKGKVYSNAVCQFWLQGKCNRNPCRFLHRELPTSNVYRRPSTSNQSNRLREEKTTRSSLADAPKKRNNNKISEGKGSECAISSLLTDVKKPPLKRTRDSSGTDECPKTKKLDAAANKTTDECPKTKKSDAAADECPETKKSDADWFSLLAQLKGHAQAICGIAQISDKLYSGSRNGIVNVWDCHTGQSTSTINLGERIGCLIAEGQWIFVGLHNSIKAWNVVTATEFTLGEGNESFGLVYAMATSDKMLFSGAQNGSILAWEGSEEKLKPFKVAASLEGHTSAVTCLTVGLKRLYSGSTDGTIKVWDQATLKCLHTLANEHTDVVRSLLCWEEYLLSCSLDKKIKVWAATEKGTIEVVYTHDVEHGALALCGMYDEEKKPVLLCSCNDNSVRLFELPSFRERGKVFSKDEVRRIETGAEGLLFTGDGTGTVSVWKVTESSSSGVGVGVVPHPS